MAQIHAMLTNSVLHDEASITEPPPETPGLEVESSYEPLPNVNMGEVIGLVQTLGKDPESIFALATRSAARLQYFSFRHQGGGT